MAAGSDAAAQSLGATGGTCLDELQSLGAAKISRLMAYGIDTVEALAKFAIQIDAIRPSIIVLLQRCVYDNDDEVRDRAAFFVSALRELGRDGDEDSTTSPVLAKFATPLGALEASLRAYGADERFESQACDLSAVDHTPEAPPTPSPTCAAPRRGRGDARHA